MSQLRAVVCTFVLVASLGSDVRAQQPPAQQPPVPDVWTELTIGGGLQVYSGDSDTIAVAGNLDWSEQFRRIETELSANVNVSHTIGDASYYAETLSSAIRWLAAIHSGPRLYPMVHTWFQHDRNAGIDLRATVAAGFGSHLVENAHVKLT